MSPENSIVKRGEIIRHVLSGTAALAVGVLVTLLLRPSHHESPSPREADVEQTEPGRVTGHGQLALLADTLLVKKLGFVTVSDQRLPTNTPVLSATGAVVARLAVGAGVIHAPGASAATHPAMGPASTRPAIITDFPAWDFGSPDLFANYTAWIQSQDDVKFNEDEASKIRGLDEAKVADLQKTADRLRKLVDAGSDAPKDLQTAESDLLQARLQMEKDIYEAEKTLKDSLKVRENLARQLTQADAPPELLRTGREGTVLVAADVPESRVPLIRIGAKCIARFYGLPDSTFEGTVERIGSVLVKDRRTLRVLFIIHDREASDAAPRNRLHCNMFADVGLGTDDRTAMTIPIDAVVHDGSTDYVLVESPQNSLLLHATEVSLGDPVAGNLVEVLRGGTTRIQLNPGDRIVSTGTILLKPYVVKALEEMK